jgi:hypothetical protein
MAVLAEEFHAVDVNVSLTLLGTSTPCRKWRLGSTRRVESYLPQPPEM